MLRHDRQARLSIYDAAPLSDVADRFGARSRLGAIRNPGQFNRPFVGRNPYYYRDQATRAMRKAVSADDHLRSLWSESNRLSISLADQSSWPPKIPGPSISDAEDVADINHEIRELVVAKGLAITLEGARLARAVDISTFALRVISDGRWDGLYAGTDPNLSINRTDYWHGVYSQLSPADAGNTL